MRTVKTFVLNGWAAAPCAWEACRFVRDRIFSYRDALDGRVEEALEAEEGAVLVGWSMGGTLALRLLAAHPGKVRGLVLVAATPRMMADAGWDGMTPRRLRALRVGLERTRGAGMGALPPGRPSPYVVDLPDDLDRGLAFLAGEDVRARLLALPEDVRRRPVALFQSEKDGIVPASHAAFLARVFPGASCRLVPGAEHALPVWIPGEIDAAVARVALEADGVPSRAVVSLGSNMGDRAAHLEAALAALAALPSTRLTAKSAVRETEPVDVPPEFARFPFLNQVAVFETRLSARAFSDAMHAAESAGGRVRTVRNGPRTIDLDLIDFDGLRSDDPALVLPHPRFRERAFVTEPLAELGVSL